MNPVLLVGGIVLAVILHFAGQDGLAGIALTVGMVLASLPSRFTPGTRRTRSRWISRAEAEADLEQLYKDMTGNYSPAELRQMEQEERDNYNENMKGISEVNDYIDYDGYRRDAATGEYLYMNRDNKPNPKRK